MRRLGLIFLAALLAAACSKSPTAAQPSLDPWWGGLLDARGLTTYPDSALIVIRNTPLRPADSLPLYTDSATIRGLVGGLFVSERCGEFSAGSGDIGQYLFRAEVFVIVGPRGQLSSTLTGPDTLAHYTLGIWNPTSSPLPGFGNDPNHLVIWRLTLTDITARSPTPIFPLPEPQGTVGDINWGAHCNAPGQTPH